MTKPEQALHNLPLAAKGLTSYRCKSPSGFSWIMIGAKDGAMAYTEALRSNEGVRREDLQVWNGCEYVPVTGLSGDTVGM